MKSYELLIVNARLVGNKVIEPCTVAVCDGKIAQIMSRSEYSGTADEISADRVIDASGKYLIPGLIDLHVHLREPGFEYKEDIASGTKCAAAGGVTSVFAMPNTKPTTDSVEVIEYIKDKAKNASCRVFPVAAITKGLKSDEICPLTELSAAGAAAFSDDGRPVMTAKMLRDAMKIGEENDLLFMSHCEDMSLAEGGAVNEGKISRMLGLKGIPNLAEDLIIERDIMIAEETGCRLHICHVSTRGGLDCIRRAKTRGVKVTAETCPHYFSLTDADVIYYGSNAKMNPPLRTEDDKQAVIEAIIDGTLDCISTDHAPHSKEEKGSDIGKSLNGIIGLQTSFVVSYTNLVQTGHITIGRLIELMAANPAKITGLDKMGLGSLAVGSPADFAIVTLGCDNTVTLDDLAGKSTNTPFVGMTFGARVDATFVNGKCMFENKEK